MEHYKQENKAIVGSYKPSDNWDKYTHFAVMDEKTGELIASCGYFQNLEKQEVSCIEDYKHFATCIEQAQLYANAPRLLCAIKDLLSNPFDPAVVAKARSVIRDIDDISEPANRLLGPRGMDIICAIEAGVKYVKGDKIKIS